MRTPAPKNAMRPVHPGEILREDYLKPLGMSANALAKALRVPASRVNDIVLERRGITVDTAMRLVRYFGGDVQSWMNLQVAYEIRTAEKTLAKTVEKEVAPRAARIAPPARTIAVTTGHSTPSTPTTAREDRPCGRKSSSATNGMRSPAS